MSKSETITVVIPHYNDLRRLERCLEALMPQADIATHVIVADNASDVPLAGLKDRWPSLTVIEQPEKGAGPARNAGAAVAQTQWLAFLDADCVPASDWLSVARRVARKDAVLGGRVTLFDETPPPRSGAQAFETVFAFQVASYLKKGFLPSCQLVMAREAFVRVGGFKNGVSEDVEWSKRATARGLKLGLEPALCLAHPTRSNWTALRTKWQRLTSEGFLTDGQGAFGRLRWGAKAMLMPVSIVGHAPRVLRQSDLDVVEASRALVTLSGLRLLRMVWMLRQAVTGRA